VIPVTDHDPDLDGSGELDELAALRSLARAKGVDAEHRLEPLEPPPADLWDRIAAEVAADDPASAAPPGATTRPAEPGGATVVELPRRRYTWLVAGAAAAAVVVVAALVSLGGTGEPEVLATATLDRLGPAGSGSAELLDDDGRLRLRVDTADLDAGDGFLELWVIDTEVQRLVSLGPLRSDGLYDLPDGLDPAAFPIVDVSVEPIDGDPTHSGDSVLRGELEL
jgi:anti-sigma-K factor RskA